MERKRQEAVQRQKERQDEERRKQAVIQKKPISKVKVLDLQLISRMTRRDLQQNPCDRRRNYLHRHRRSKIERWNQSNQYDHLRWLYPQKQ
jgi:hypothetical protein